MPSRAELPIIERDGEYEQKIDEHLHLHGFAAVRFPMLSSQARKLAASWKAEFFDRDVNVKSDHSRSERGGYYSVAHSEQALKASEPDWKEYFQVYPGEDMIIPRSLIAETIDYFDSAYTWGAALLSTWRLSLLPSSQDSLLRIIHYPPAKGRNRIVAAAHEDVNLLTVLPSSGQPGLEVLFEGRFLKVPCDENLVVLNCGDALSDHDNSYKSATHRVIRSSEQGSRMSLPLFIHPSKGSILRDKNVSAGEALDKRLAQIERRVAT